MPFMTTLTTISTFVLAIQLVMLIVWSVPWSMDTSPNKLQFYPLPDPICKANDPKPWPCSNWHRLIPIIYSIRMI